MMMVDNLSLMDLALWVSGSAGTLFICYSFATFIQQKLDNTVRLVLSVLFMLIGILFFSTVGSILSGRAVEFTILSLIIVVLLAMLGLVFIYLIYHPNSFPDQEKSNKDKNTDL